MLQWHPVALTKSDETASSSYSGYGANGNYYSGNMKKSLIYFALMWLCFFGVLEGIEVAAIGLMLSSAAFGICVGSKDY